MSLGHNICTYTSRAVGHLLEDEEIAVLLFCRFPYLTLADHSSDAGILYG